MSRLLTECFNAVTFIHASSDMVPYFAPLPQAGDAALSRGDKTIVCDSANCVDVAVLRPGGTRSAVRCNRKNTSVFEGGV